jgi:hypothetical protein
MDGVTGAHAEIDPSQSGLLIRIKGQKPNNVSIQIIFS